MAAMWYIRGIVARLVLPEDNEIAVPTAVDKDVDAFRGGGLQGSIEAGPVRV